MWSHSKLADPRGTGNPWAVQKIYGPPAIDSIYFSGEPSLSIASSRTSEYAVSSLFGSLDIVLQQADLYACTVRALGQISVAHPNQVDAIHRDLEVQHQETGNEAAYLRELAATASP